MASAKVVQLKPKKVTAQLLCSGCGISQDAACECGKAYVPATKVAAKAIARHPEKSNRAIAEELGIDDKTVAKARRAGAENSAPETRTGRDGKSYPATQPKREPPSLSIVEKMLGEQRYEAKLILREVSASIDRAVTRILAFGQKYPNMEEAAREAFTILLTISSSRLADTERQFNSKE